MNADAAKFPDLHELLIEQSPDAIIFADSSGIIRIWSSAAERIFGFTKSDALGTNINIIIPERLRDAHWRGFERALAECTTKYAGQALPTKAVCSDGTQIYVEFSFAIVIDAKGDALGALAHARDITKRFEKERVDRKHLQALEKLLESKV